MKKFVLIISIFLVNIHISSQWVLDYQFEPLGSKGIYSISVTDSAFLWLVTIDSTANTGIFKKSNSIITELNSIGIYRPTVIEATDTNQAYLGGQRLYYTSNSGSNWLIRLDSNGSGYGFAVANNSPSFVAAATYLYDSAKSRVMISTNGGVNWLLQNILFPPDHDGYSISMTDDQHINVGINCQESVCPYLSYSYTSNGGTNWLFRTFPLVSNNTIIMAPEFDRNNEFGFTFAVGYYVYRYRTTNGGNNWSNAEFFSNGMTEGMTGIINVDSSDIWFNGTFKKVYKSTNNGISWSEMTISLHDSDNISSMDVIRKGNKYYAYIGTRKGRLYKLVENVVPIGVNVISSELPIEYSLSQNYPNPFNPTTKITFDLPKSGFVKVSIYDVLGKEVELLVNELLQPAKYEVSFNAVNLPSGVYFYKLETDGFIDTKKMILLK